MSFAYFAVKSFDVGGEGALQQPLTAKIGKGSRRSQSGLLASYFRPATVVTAKNSYRTNDPSCLISIRSSFPVDGADRFTGFSPKAPVYKQVDPADGI
jgi:hypothetical protein